MSSLIIATNIMGINSHRSLKIASQKTEKSSEKLSSGYRINRAADDAAGLAISEKMRNQIKGLNMAYKNVEDGISLVQCADAGMGEIGEMIKRKRELIIQAMNDTNSSADRSKIQAEINQLTAEIDATAYRTEFNEIPLLSIPSTLIETNDFVDFNYPYVLVGDTVIHTGVNTVGTVDSENRTVTFTVTGRALNSSDPTVVALGMIELPANADLTVAAMFNPPDNPENSWSGIRTGILLPQTTPPYYSVFSRR